MFLPRSTEMNWLKSFIWFYVLCVSCVWWSPVSFWRCASLHEISSRALKNVWWSGRCLMMSTTNFRFRIEYNKLQRKKNVSQKVIELKPESEQICNAYLHILNAIKCKIWNLQKLHPVRIPLGWLSKKWEFSKSNSNSEFRCDLKWKCNTINFLYQISCSSWH